MDKGRLPLEGWIVVEHLSIGVILASRHEDQSQAEAECARRNGAARSARYRACLVLEPIAEGMGAIVTRPLPLAAAWTNTLPARRRSPLRSSYMPSRPLQSRASRCATCFG